jgi:hypothetical protein
MNDTELADAIGKAHWRFTPYHGFPHEYILDSKDPEVWRELARRIDEEGYWEYFFKATVRYYNLTGWKYWRCEEVLNRAPLPDNEIWTTQKWRDALALRAGKDKS